MSGNTFISNIPAEREKVQVRKFGAFLAITASAAATPKNRQKSDLRFYEYLLLTSMSVIKFDGKVSFITLRSTLLYFSFITFKKIH